MGDERNGDNSDGDGGDAARVVVGLLVARVVLRHVHGAPASLGQVSINCDQSLLINYDI